MKIMRTMELAVLCFLGGVLGEGFLAYGFRPISSGDEVGWNTSRIPYRIYENGSDNFRGVSDGNGSAINEFDIIHRSFETWANVDGAEIDFDYEGITTTEKTGIDGTNTVIWIESGWRALPFAPPAGALAVTISSYDLGSGNMIDADIHFNGEYFEWAHVDTAGEANRVDLQSIATHEIGHFIGLDHSSDDPLEDDDSLRESTMFYAASPGDIDGRTLAEDDILGVRHLYPSSHISVAQPSIATVVPNSESNDSRSTTLRISGRGMSQYSSIRLVHADGLGPDIVANKTTVNGDGSLLEATIRLYNAVPGTYHVLVNNSRKVFTKLKEGFEVVAAPGYKYTNNYYANYYGSGCGITYQSVRSASLGNFLFLIVALAVVYGMTGRRYLIRSGVKENRRSRY